MLWYVLLRLQQANLNRLVGMWYLLLRLQQAEQIQISISKPSVAWLTTAKQHPVVQTWFAKQHQANRFKSNCLDLGANLLLPKPSL